MACRSGIWAYTGLQTSESKPKPALAVWDMYLKAPYRRVTGDAAKPALPAKTGLAVGQKASAFTLKDQNGRSTSLEALLRNGPVALVFHRSADW